MISLDLGFISDENLISHIKKTIDKYRFCINFEEFNSNIIDPIKMTFDSKVYKKKVEEIIDSEIKRQLDKSNNNHIGYFHQNIFNFIGKEQGWFVPERGFDIENTLQKIFVEMKNKHNTMNSSSSQKTFIKMQSQIMQDPESTCYLVEVIAKKSQNIPWRVSLDGRSFLDERIRRISIDQFYELVTGNPLAFCKLCEVLPYALKHVVSDLSDKPFCNTVFQEIHPYSADTLKGIYKKSFETYTGFQSMEFKNG